MKKLIALILSAIFLLTVVAACTRYVSFERYRPNETTERAWTTPKRTNPPSVTTLPRETEPRETASPPATEPRETEPPNETPPPLTPMPPAIPTLPDRFTWHIEPTLWFEHGLWHWQGIFYTGWVYISGIGEFPAIQVDPYTGELKETFYIAGAGSGAIDGWILCAQTDMFFLGNDWSGYIAYTRDEFYEQLSETTIRHLILKVDLVIYGYPCIWTYRKDLHFEYLIGRALFRGYEQITDFIFGWRSFGNCHSAWNWNPQDMFSATLQETGLFGFVDTEGGVILPFIFDNIYFIREGGIFVEYQGYWGVINIDNLFVYEPLLIPPQCCCDFYQYPYAWRRTW